MPTVNFVGCAQAIRATGAKIVYADVDVNSFNILPEEITRLRTKRTKAVMVLHYGGHPAPMASILEVSGGLAIMEECANAVLSSYFGSMCGSIGDVAVFSFDSMKILVMVDGGALVVRDEKRRRRARSLRYLGMDPGMETGVDASLKERTRWWEFKVSGEPSGRYISNDVFAAVGLMQMKTIREVIGYRKFLWGYYQEQLRDAGGVVRPPDPVKGCTSSYYTYWIRSDHRDELAACLLDHGVYTTLKYFPLHKAFGVGGKFPNAEKISETALNLPLHQNISVDDIDLVCDIVKRYV
jgi:aminotransferase